MSIPGFTSLLFAIIVAMTLIGPAARANGHGGQTTARDPADSKAAVPPVRYDSAFARYRLNAETEVGTWRDANDNVGRIGGWRVYGREAIPAPTADRPPAASPGGGPATGRGAEKTDRGPQ